MSLLSIFDVFKVGIGPSSSHTMGPWEAAVKFRNQIQNFKIDEIKVHIFGSLALTGKGHYTDKAITFGLLGYTYSSHEVNELKNDSAFGKQQFHIELHQQTIVFDPSQDILSQRINNDPLPNKMCFYAYRNGREKIKQQFYSIGGGNLVESNEELNNTANSSNLKLTSPQQVLDQMKTNGMSACEFLTWRENEINSSKNMDQTCKGLTDQMKQTVIKGLNKEGYLPGVLKVKRRSGDLFKKLTNTAELNTYMDIRKSMRSRIWSFDEISTLISAIAMACNEENASMNAVVTAPTNGSCGVIPACIYYFDAFEKALSANELKEFILISGMIGILYKNAATISGAVGGCMAEIGVASSMAAAGLTHLKGGSIDQIFMSAEIAMEHHLGLTCDPIAGLVQIPCIERNAMGAIKAITASNIAMHSDPKNAVVKFKDVVKAMNDTAKSMNKRFKETSLGGLAINVNVPEC